MKKIVSLVIICMFTVSFYGQNPEVTKSQPKHEISLWGAYGLSTLNYNWDLSYGQKKCGLGYLGGIGYNYYFNYHWGFGLGAEYSVLSAEAKFPKFMDKYVIQIPNDSHLKNLEINAMNYKQTYDLVYVNVPITLQYQTDFWKQNKFYVAGGVKVGIPLDGKYSAEGDFSAVAYEQDKYGENTGDPITIDRFGMTDKPGEGRTRSGAISDAAFDLDDINVMLTIEPGFKWRLSNKVSLYTGVFLDYGLTEIRKNADSEAKTFDYANRQYTINNVLESNYARDNVKDERVAFADKVSTISAGLKLKLGIAFGAPRNKATKVVEVVEVPKPLTFDEIDEIVSRNTDKIIQNQDKGVKDIKDMLADMFKKEKAEIKEGIRLETVREFELDKVAIRSVMNYVLQNNLTVLKNNPGINIMLVGHTDEIGGNDYNYNLGMRRATTIKDWLVSQGIDGSRLKISSKGNTQHEVPNKDEATRKYNRRVEFLIER